MNGIDRTGTMETKLHAFGMPQHDKTIREAGFYTDTSEIRAGWQIGVSPTMRRSDIVWYGSDGQVNGAYFREGEGTNLTGRYFAMRLFMTPDLAGQDVRVHGYFFSYLVRGRKR